MSLVNYEARALAFLEKYGEYKDNADLYLEMMVLKQQLKKEGKSEFEVRRSAMEYDKQYKELIDKNKIVETEIVKELKSFSQELLVTIYEMSQVVGIKELVKSQVRKNNTEIDNLNNIKLESGIIFDYLDRMSKERKIGLLRLRETEDDLEIDGLKLSSFSPIVRKYIFKSINGNLEEEKQEFIDEHGFKSDSEFKFYQDMMMKREGRRIAEETQAMFNRAFGANDDTLIKEMEDVIKDMPTNKPPKKH